MIDFFRRIFWWTRRGSNPRTSRMRTVRSPKLSYGPMMYEFVLILQIGYCCDGTEPDVVLRPILDLTDANRTLSQLSYAPKLWNLFNF